MSITGRVLITGGSGTLGTAIVRTALAENWRADFTIFSRSEQQQAIMRQRYPHCRYILGDVRDEQRVSDAIAGHDMVIHAAAMKMIPECEAQPTECYQTNVLGSANVIRACRQHNVETCIGISTDKACQAITAYGASKLLMESLFRAAGNETTRFVLCRYGNVVASRGSVIPLWQKQVEQGQPLTITDPEMTRFFMSERDAVNTIAWVSEKFSGALAIPKMRALKITDLASALFPDHPQQIIGLRSTEKRHEWLIHQDEAAYFREYNGYFLRFPEQQTRMAVSTFHSAIAPRLSSDDFMDMLAQAQAAEVAA
jgi:UDP-N-acetylglucosamine 4,6-dehydratase